MTDDEEDAPRRWESLLVGAGGWASWGGSELPKGHLLVRFAEVGHRLVPVTLLVEHDKGIGPDLLRGIALGRLEAWANSGKTAERIRSRLSEPAPNFSHLSFDEETLGTGTAYSELLMGGELVAAGETFWSAERRAWVWEAPDAQLPTPHGRPYPDSFYQAVAEVYGKVIEAGQRPGPAIANANEVPVTTVHRWVREARKRGFLPPATPGKAG